MPTTTTTINLGVFATGSNDRIELTIDKDFADWNNINSVTATFTSPTGDTFDRPMVLQATNVWYYVTTTTELDAVGTWTLSVAIVDGTVTKRYPYPIRFIVTDP